MQSSTVIKLSFLLALTLASCQHKADVVNEQVDSAAKQLSGYERIRLTVSGMK